jgi:hypothetical protein
VADVSDGSSCAGGLAVSLGICESEEERQGIVLKGFAAAKLLEFPDQR